MWPFRSKAESRVFKARHLDDFGPFGAVFGPSLGYLSLLNLHGADAEETCKLIAELVESNKDSPAYIRLMLRDINWRPHLVACIASLASTNREEFAQPMWTAFDAGSWVAPQLAVVLSSCDSNFEKNAKLRIARGCPVDVPRNLDGIERHHATGPAGVMARSGKNTASLLEMLAIRGGNDDWVAKVRSKRRVRNLVHEDFDDSVGIVRHWVTRLHSTLEPLNIRI